MEPEQQAKCGMTCKKSQEILNDAQVNSNQQFFLLIVYGVPASGKSSFVDLLQSNLRNPNYQSAENIFCSVLSIDSLQGFLTDNKFQSQQVLQKLKKEILAYSRNIQSNQQPDPISKLRKFTINRSDFNEKRWKDSRLFVKDNLEIIFESVLKSRESYSCLNKNKAQELMNQGETKHFNKELRKRILIIEDDFLLNSQRKPYRKFAAQQKVKYLQIMMNTSKQQALKNNQARILNKQASQPDKYYLDPQVIKYADTKIQFARQKPFAIQINPFESKTNLQQLLNHAIVPQFTQENTKQKQQEPYVCSFRQAQQIAVRKFISALIKQPQKHQQILKGLPKDKKQLSTFLAKTKKKLKSGQGVSKLTELIKLQQIHQV